MQFNDEKNLFEQYHVDWETINVVLGNVNVIDIPRLSTRTIEEAADFIRGYGYDLSNPKAVEEIENLRTDALHFLDKRLLQDPDYNAIKLVIPNAIQNETDITKLMVMATIEKGENRRFACALLRVMHTLTHVNNDLSVNFFPAIQKQILECVLGFVHTDSAGDVYLGEDETGIRLYMLDIKTQKSYDSLVLKLLHKEKNTSAAIFDQMGFRFVVFNKLDALRALKYLQQNVFAFPNVRIDRSRNTLIDIGRFHNMLDRLAPAYAHNEISDLELTRKAMEIANSDECNPRISQDKLRERNLYSSTEYSSLQVTCRQLVRVKGPPIDHSGMTQMTQNKNEDNKESLIDYKFFFPYEIQILDRESYIKSREGRASHSEYKRSQLRSARERVFPWLVQEDFESQTS